MFPELKKEEPRIQALLDKMGLVLFDMKWHRSGKRSVLTIFIDRDEGEVNLSDCEHASSAIGTYLDEVDLIRGQYFLEVSSPGVERPLRGPKDFLRFKSFPVKVKLSPPLEKRTVIVGTLMDYDHQKETILVREKETEKDFSILVEHISQIRLRLEV